MGESLLMICRERRLAVWFAKKYATDMSDQWVPNDGLASAIGAVLNFRGSYLEKWELVERGSPDCPPDILEYEFSEKTKLRLKREKARADRVLVALEKKYPL
jgi:hypothetical protein